MSGDFISREAAISKIRDEGVLGGDYDAYEREEDVVNTLKSIPAADVVEVRHERWKDIGIIWLDKDNMPDGISTMFCPVCERYATKVYLYGDPVEMMNYCPSCGAKMDGGMDNG